MKALKHTLCILLAALMLLSAAPAASVVSLYNGLTALAANGASLEINYENTQNNSLAEAVKESVGYFVNTVDRDRYFQGGDQYHWNHTDELTISNEDMTGLRKFLSQPGYTYISLSGNIDKHITRQYEFEPIVIRESKVLDLNGYSITLRNDANKHNGGQSPFPEMHRAHMFEIQNGATLTIIDSSRSKYNRFGKGGDETGTGFISHTGVMIYPFSNDMEFYTTRDLFWVMNGTLVVYGGTFQAGRQKDQRKNKFSWSKLRTCIGTAVELGVNVAKYATGIDAAVSAGKDLTAGFAAQSFTDNPDDDGFDDSVKSTVNRTGADAPPEALAESSAGKDSRDKSVNEKAGGAQEADSTGSARKVNQQMAESRKNITNSVMNQSGIGGIVDGIFSFGQQIANMTGKDENSRVTEVIHGTPVHLGTDGTFICYGGKFIGYGSSPNTRNAVVEITVDPQTENSKTKKLTGGMAYIYGGTFEGCAGANIFNFVQTYTATQQVQQVSGYNPSNKFQNVVAMKESETNGLKVLNDSYSDANGNPISTRNVTVRGGTFRNYYDLRMLSLKVPGDSEHFTKFPGTPGGLGLGVDSFDADMIKDGRIQIIDKYGDGNLVLMDEQKNPNEKVYHYRLFCSDLELRYKQYIAVQPNERVTNTTHTFHLESVTSDKPEIDVSTGWTNEDGNERTGPFNQTETVFSYPLDSIATPTYYVMPHLDARDSSGAGIENSNIWYYMDPMNTKGETVPIYTNRSVMIRGTAYSGKSTVLNQQHVTDRSAEKTVAVLDPGTIFTYAHRYSYLSKVKWFTYRVYQVDPLTRNNLNSGGAYGENKPLCELVYGVSADTLECKITLTELEKYMKKTVNGFTGYKQGEMYRIELTMEEHLAFDVQHYNTEYDYNYQPSFGTRLPVAAARSSILFKCYSVNELKDLGGKVKDVDYTALQWTAEPEAGKYASVQIVNGQAGKTDYLARKIFDVYYQWYAVDKNGKETMIAGTDNIYYNNDAGKARHTYEFWNVTTDGHTYVNTVDPNDPNAAKYTWHGLPDPANRNKEWSDTLLHAYTHQMTTSRGTLQIDPNKEASPDNNRAFATNEDSVYIPASLAGQKIYCKVIVVNVLWQKEFDHVQVFYSHPVQLKDAPADPVSSTLSFWRNNKGLYVSADDPASIHFNTLTGLSEGETVKRVTYYANGRSKTISNLKAKTAQAIPTVKYPQDFYPANYDLSKLPAGEVRVTAFIELSSGRGTEAAGGAKGFRTDKAITFPFDIKVQKLLFGAGEGTVTVDLADRNNPEKLKKQLKAVYQPYNATYGGITINVNNFTSSNRNVATLNAKGELLLGAKTGETVITLLSPDGARPTVTVRVVKRVDAIEVSGLDAPEVGKAFDRTAEVPEGALYGIKEVYWTDETDGGRVLGANEKAQDFHYYTAHVTVTHEQYDLVNPDAEMTLTLTQPDDSVTTFKAGYGDLTVASETLADGTLGDVSFAYAYKAVKGGIMGSTVHALFLDYPTEVPAGDYIEDWLAKVEISTDLADYELPAETSLFFNKNYAEIFKELNYPAKNPSLALRFIEGVQNGLQVTSTLPTGVSFDPNMRVYVNGKPLSGIPDARLNVAGRNFSLSLPGGLTVTPGKPVPANTAIVRMKDFNLTAEQGYGKDTVFLDELRDGTDAYKVTMRGGEPSHTDYVTVSYSNDMFGRPHYQFNAWEDSGARPVTLPIFADLDLDGDRRPDLTLDWTVNKRIYPTASSMPAIPETPVRTVTVKILKPDGGTYTSVRYSVDKERFTDVLKLPPDALIFSVTAGSGPCTLNLDGTVTPPAGDASINWTVRTVNANTALRLSAGANTVFAESDLPAMQFSVDGVNWTSFAVSGFEKDADQGLMYRQCLTGEAHATAVRTAKQSYGVWVGGTEVTERNADLMQLNGWKYDPASETLTLYNLSLDDRGVPNAEGIRSAVSAAHSLTVVLCGDNAVDPDALKDRSCGIYAAGDLTITGNGTLRINGTGVGIEAANITVDVGGTLEFSNTDLALATHGDKGGIKYMNGILSFTPYVITLTGGTKTRGQFLKEGQTVSFENAYHRDHLFFDIDDDSYENRTGETQFNACADVPGKRYYVFMQHYGAADWTVQNRDTFDGVSCAEGGVFHPICTVCGKVNYSSQHAAAPGAHDLVSYPAKAPTCSEPGWKAYQECTRCPYTTFEVLPANGHSWTEHDAIAPTCTAPGTPGYRTCSVCGISTLASDYEASGSESAWEPKAHDIVHVKGAAATEDTPGVIEHYECTACKAVFADAAGMKPLTKDETVIPVPGEEESTVYKLGDVDNDDNITAADARLALRRAVDLESFAPDSPEFIACDVNKDGSVTAGDARSILRAAVDLEDPSTW